MGLKRKFVRHEKTELVIYRLSLLAKGETLVYEALALLIGADPQLEGYGFVKTARDVLTRQGFVFRAVGSGIRRLTDQEIALCDSRRKRIRTQARRQIREKSNADLGHLSLREQAAVTSDVAIGGSIMHFTDIHFVESQRTHLSKEGLPNAPPPIPG